MRSQHKRNARFGHPGRIIRRQFPVFHLREVHQLRIERVFHIVSFRKIERKNKGGTSCFQLDNALVFVAIAFEEVGDAEFFAECRRAQRFQFVAHFENLGQRLHRVPGRERNVRLCFLGGVPLAVVVRLAQQGNAPHQRAGVVLARTAFAERKVVRNLFFDNGQVLLLIC